MNEVIREHLRGVVAVLSAFVLASSALLVADVPPWSAVAAAVLALVSLSLLVAWLPLPRSEWTARSGRRLFITGAPMFAAAVVVVAGVSLAPGKLSVNYTFPVTLILLDSSERMLEPFAGGSSKFDEAVKALKGQVRDLGNDQLGLVTFGVDSCQSSDSPIRQVVPIAANRANQITTRAGELEPAGQSNLVSAGLNAIGLLNHFEDERIRILVVAGGLDGCGGNLRDLLSESEFKGVAVQWEIVGLGLSSSEKSEIQRLPSEVTVHTADSQDELQEVFRQVLFEEPIRSELDRLRDYVETDIRLKINKAISANNDRDPAQARANIDEMRRLSESSEERFGKFPSTGELEVFAGLKEMLKVQFDLLQEIGTKQEALADFDEDHTGTLDDEEQEERNDLVDSGNDVVSSYNSNLSELGDLIEDALDDLFGGR